MSSSSSSWDAPPSALRRPQQYYGLESQEQQCEENPYTSILRQTPPGAFYGSYHPHTVYRQPQLQPQRSHQLQQRGITWTDRHPPPLVLDAAYSNGSSHSNGNGSGSSHPKSPHSSRASDSVTTSRFNLFRPRSSTNNVNVGGGTSQSSGGNYNSNQQYQYYHPQPRPAPNNSNPFPIMAPGFKTPAPSIQQYQQQQQHHHPLPFLSPPEEQDVAIITAADVAREAPRAGFLLKLGANVPAFKRRFFVLQARTHLYYFLSANDANPRGCLDLEKSWTEPVGELADGRYRFAVCWNDHPKVVLEARSKQVGLEWMESLQTERLSYSHEQMAKAARKQSAMASRIAELEAQLQNYRLVEKDRDGALEDAAKWKQEFETLDESLRRLTQRIRQPLENEPLFEKKSSSSGGGGNVPNEESQRHGHVVESVEDADEKKDPDHKDNTAEHDNEEGSASAQKNPSRETSLLDEAVEDEENNNNELMDVMTVPGAHYSALWNSCEQLRENLRLASEEASTAVEDLTNANERVQKIEKRMAKAEKHLCKLWEENCSIRKALKQKKRERRVLIREVKNLRDTAAAAAGGANGNRIREEDWSDHGKQQLAADDASSVNGNDEEKLLQELEDHVATSIRLHEQLLGAGGSTSATTNNDADAGLRDETTTTGEETQSEAQKNSLGAAALLFPTSDKQNDSNPQTPLTSLFDASDDDSETEAEDEPPEAASVAPSISSMDAEASDTEALGGGGGGGGSHRATIVFSLPASASSRASTPERRNPLLYLDEDDDSEQPQLCAASSQSESSKSVVTSNGQATSKLMCPLADVVGAHDVKCKSVTSEQDDFHVYHLTFYSRKIGIQFQKVPPPPVRAKGLLTDAMTADLAVSTAGSSDTNTAAELRRIAAISTWAKSNGVDRKGEDVCQLATPIDAVLVCGFVGFDDSGTNVRPKLGARLVAFDGVSVEIGKWTFDSIRKAIQARDRPLTLSFRNDFLTTEQRFILTKAIKDVGQNEVPPLRPTILSHKTAINPRQRQPSPLDDPSVHSALSHESDHFVNNGRGVGRTTSAHRLRMYTHEDDDMSISVGSSSDCRTQKSIPQSFSGARSFTSGNFRSFSEAGSSTTSVLSAVAPLVSNLLYRNSNREPFTPDYLRREPESVEDTPQHQDFKSELL